MFKRLNVKMLKWKGFTLIELLVVISIVVILTVIIVPNFRNAEKQLALNRSAHKMVQDIRRAQEMAMSAKTFNGSVPSGGYGIHFRLSWKTYYKIYADSNNNQAYDAGDGEVETINLEKGVYIKNISPSSLSVNFKPPDPVTKITTEAGADSAFAAITLSLEANPTKEKIITINKAGLIQGE
ncbi:MAG: prepilin-type N-terminal cleavage/methylation domain-containing protein [bacterium]|nr:prepilin-type N-terminal cleavage/methylation domain-containing protein [bacterium]